MKTSIFHVTIKFQCLAVKNHESCKHVAAN